MASLLASSSTARSASVGGWSAFRVPPATDLTRWRLEGVDGQQVWRYYDAALGETPPAPLTVRDKYLLGIDISGDVPVATEPAKTAQEAANRGMHFYTNLQCETGHWPGDYGGPHFLLPGLLITAHITGIQLGEFRKAEMMRYLRNTVTAEGGWGLHTADKATVFGTGLNYVAFRLLGGSRDDPLAVKARTFLHKHDGVLGIPSWGKFWLALLNVYDYDGMNAVPPELWLLPEWAPLHPKYMWCHCRQVYLPMSYCYGVKLRAPVTPIIAELREELYTQAYDTINWPAQRFRCAKIDLYNPHSWIMDWSFSALNVYEKFHSTSIRKRALDMALDHIRAEDENTQCVGIGPISKNINMICQWYAHGPQSPLFRQHVSRFPDYLWLGIDGMKLNGTNGSQLWDTAFAVQAFLEAGGDKNAQLMASLRKAHSFFKLTQIRKNVPEHEKYFRQMSKGGFPFSTRDCGWIVADCTAEGIKSTLMLENTGQISSPFEEERYHDAIDVLLSMQNSDGGYATYETKRGPEWLELFNPSEVFGAIMIDYTYVELTSAVVQALASLTVQFPKYRTAEISATMKRAVHFIRSIQRKDGSWEGCWAVCFTYGTWFGIEALATAGEGYYKGTASPSMRSACDFLVSKQRADGSWSESYMSCVERRYIEHTESQVINTAWAVLGLMAAEYPDRTVVERGIQFIMSKQLMNGDWPDDEIKGVFNKNCMIVYPNYKNAFTIWALGRYANSYSKLE
ncbi:lss protein [Capsaspora owczarzaki ATCC 30864]|uniref:Terpene cyclase/mutase family member n=1 Tax=Capsaspora owczarzaki (strain ATCC 30864) TaxID=595528 RepID=A0A0D2X137_CAPO3|nr:lss protein [Capsaspora owczarzaki ATCC 30864]KJE90129.1 lss protein [Capsaspora owczarzaki ATCC 30864]|eukprot:XP_004364346.1 lss protein [Capsaspora owczarzaki ATCC 30864]